VPIPLQLEKEKPKNIKDLSEEGVVALR